MLKQFILWLVTKFLTSKELYQYVAKQDFLDSPGRAINHLYTAAYDLKPAKPVKSFDLLNAEYAVANGYRDSVFVMSLVVIRDRLIACSHHECSEEAYKAFFIKVTQLKVHHSALKVRKDLTKLVRDETTLVSEHDIDLVVHVLQNNFIHPEATTKFITTLGA